MPVNWDMLIICMLKRMLTEVCFWWGRTVGRAYGQVITKISRMGGLPNFLGYGALLWMSFSPLFKWCHCERDLFEDSTDKEKKRRVLPQGRKEVIIGNFIIWLNPRAGSMKRFLCSDWLPERARWADRTHSRFSALKIESRGRKFSYVQFLYIPS